MRDERIEGFRTRLIANLAGARRAEALHEATRDIVAKTELCAVFRCRRVKRFKVLGARLYLRRSPTGFTSEPDCEGNIFWDSPAVGIENGEHRRPAKDALFAVSGLETPL